MHRATRLRRVVRILILLGAALVWMGPPRPPMPPGCRGPRPPAHPHPFHEAVDTISPESRDAR